MGCVTASAPGKVLLSGEYAVLDGAPAISMAVNRRASVSIDAGSRPAVECHGLSGKSDTRLLDSVCQVLGIDRPGAAIRLDTGAFTDGGSGDKLGLGSSAALTVALATALSPAATAACARLETARRAHENFQEGHGSGVDVATSVAGGLIEYRDGAPPRPLRWPADLDYAVLWSGVPASTPAKLRSFCRQAARPSRADLASSATAIADLWSGGTAGALLEGLRDYVAALSAFDVDYGLGIFDAGHDELARTLTSRHAVYKPCGAGGGDIGIVLGSDPDEVDRCAQNALSRGFRRLDLALDPQGAMRSAKPA